MFKLRDYQERIVEQGKSILRQRGILYLAMEVRTGKTLTVLHIVDAATNVLFVTKKKAIPSIEKDIETAGMNPRKFTLINYESLHKLQDVHYSAVIVDEAHRLGSFPKPSKAAKQLREIVKKNDAMVVMLSGTPTPESYSQIFHQLWISPRSPFAQFNTFYHWARTGYVNVKKKKVSRNMVVNDYSSADAKKVKEEINPIMIRFSQNEAGFSSVIEEEILTVRMKDSTYKLCDMLMKDLVVQGREQSIVADTPVKLQSKLHQLYSGTIKFEDGTRRVLDLSKAEYVRDKFVGKKLAIFYKFTAEYLALKEVFGDLLTNEVAEFDAEPTMHIALQIQSGREGTKLSSADVLIFYNIDFSATSYWQGRDRMTTMDRKFNKVYWLFSEGGIETKVYDMVVKKKSYTNYYFKRDFKFKKQTSLNL